MNRLRRCGGAQSQDPAGSRLLVLAFGTFSISGISVALSVSFIQPSLCGKEVRSMPQAEYLLGHSEKEIERLTRQARLLRPITERLLREIGLRPGMRVLDLGCGAGDVSMLAAELAGPSGVVVGIDRNLEVLSTAREKARAAGLSQVQFKQASVELLPELNPFDLVIGRYVLIHQSDPVAFLQAGAAQVRPGGILAFHEIGYFGEFIESCRSMPLLRQVAEWILEAFRGGMPYYDVGRRLMEQFVLAQLPDPKMFCEVLIGGGSDSAITDWLLETLETVLPQLSKGGVVSEESVPIDFLKASIAEDVERSHRQIIGPAQICAWVRL
jgi:2-polyprenyl-3-methyl-5-hydroxy-6-metoxy-1,4-benzoquinol methylase